MDFGSKARVDILFSRLGAYFSDQSINGHPIPLTGSLRLSKFTIRVHYSWLPAVCEYWISLRQHHFFISDGSWFVMGVGGRRSRVVALGQIYLIYMDVSEDLAIWPSFKFWSGIYLGLV